MNLRAISVAISLPSAALRRRRERNFHLAERDGYTLRPLSFLLIVLVAVTHQALADQAVSVDDARTESAGIRKIASNHLVLYTDVVNNAAVDRLPAEFDKAVPLWAAYFGVDVVKTANWQARAFLVGDRRRFAALGLMPPGYDNFANGVTIGSDMWLHDQPSDYYRRHLLLHEGTHAFMTAFLGGCGPGWYMEGMAELLGTHRLDERGDLVLDVMPRTREEVPMLGRIKLIDDAIAAGRMMTLPAIMQLNNRQQLGNEAYAWCWAAVKLLDANPRYSKQFRDLRTIVERDDFNREFLRRFAADWADLNAEWQAYIAAIDYGYNFERMAIDFQSGKPLAGGEQTATISADRGWQSSGALLEAGKTYGVTATGRYEIAVEKDGGAAKPWPCEPGGVTIEYHDGRPLGILLGTIDSRDERSSTLNATFGTALVIGMRATIKPTASGTLYLRVNDWAGKLDDNLGTLTATIRERR
jgi:hypothetical protein